MSSRLPNWPAEFETGLIPTDNAMGIMTEELSPAAEAFVKMAATAERPLLDIGAAYGNATLPALAAGATVWANDLSVSQLGILADCVLDEDRKRLVLVPGRFPDDLTLDEGGFDGILCALVLHFFDGPGVQRAMAALHRWLAPGRAVYIAVITPSNSYYRDTLASYAERERNGDPWPGILDPRPLHPPRWRSRLPPMVHLFEKQTLRRVAEGAGFEIESLEYFCYRKFPEHFRTNGREYLSLIAKKR
jgi:SAM-dependent methyltransferase